MISKYFEGRVPAPNDYAVEGFDWPEAARTAHAGAVAAVERFDLPAAIEAGLDLIRRIDSYIEATQPFKMARDEAQREPLAAVLYNCAEGIRVASMLLYAVIPDKITELWRRMGLDIDPTAGGLEQLARWGQLEPGSPIEKGDPLFRGTSRRSDGPRESAVRKTPCLHSTIQRCPMTAPRRTSTMRSACTAAIPAACSASMTTSWT
jgi:methionyl-tRNA synthetase